MWVTLDNIPKLGKTWIVLGCWDVGMLGCWDVPFNISTLANPSAMGPSHCTWERFARLPQSAIKGCSEGSSGVTSRWVLPKPDDPKTLWVGGMKSDTRKSAAKSDMNWNDDWVMWINMINGKREVIWFRWGYPSGTCRDWGKKKKKVTSLLWTQPSCAVHHLGSLRPCQTSTSTGPVFLFLQTQHKADPTSTGTAYWPTDFGYQLCLSTQHEVDPTSTGTAYWPTDFGYQLRLSPDFPSEFLEPATHAAKAPQWAKQFWHLVISTSLNWDRYISLHPPTTQIAVEDSGRMMFQPWGYPPCLDRRITSANHPSSERVETCWNRRPGSLSRTVMLSIEKGCCSQIWRTSSGAWASNVLSATRLVVSSLGTWKKSSDRLGWPLVQGSGIPSCRRANRCAYPWVADGSELWFFAITSCLKREASTITLAKNLETISMF